MPSRMLITGDGLAEKSDDGNSSGISPRASWVFWNSEGEDQKTTTENNIEYTIFDVFLQCSTEYLLFVACIRSKVVKGNGTEVIRVHSVEDEVYNAVFTSRTSNMQEIAY